MQLKRKYERKVMRLSDIKEDSDNPNKMTKHQEEALDNSLARFGYVQDIVIDKSSLVVADGGHRLKKLKEKGVQEAEVILFPFKDDNERRLFRQVANKVHGEHTPELDALEFKKLLEHEDMEELTNLIGTTEQEVLNIINKSQEEEKEAVEQVGQVYKHKHKCPKCGFEYEKEDKK